MNKICSLKEKNKLDKYSVEVINNIKSTITLLDENYGEERKSDSDLGGCVLLAENIVDIEIFKQDKLQ